jgi:DNA-binding MarR family transcriptional regulator
LNSSSENEINSSTLSSSTSSSDSSDKFDPIEIWRNISNNYRILHRDVERALSPTGLSLAELRILHMLEELGPSPMRKLTNDILITPGAMTGLIDGLEDKGFVERIRSKDDRRVITIKNTSKGETILKRAKSLHKQYVEKKLKSLSKAEIFHFVRLLDKLSNSS